MPPTNQRTGESSNTAMPPTNQRTGESSNTAMPPTNQRTGESSNTAMPPTNQRTGESSNTAMPPTNQRTGESSNTAMPPTNQRTGESSNTAMPPTNQRARESSNTLSSAQQGCCHGRSQDFVKGTLGIVANILSAVVLLMPDTNVNLKKRITRILSRIRVNLVKNRLLNPFTTGLLHTRTGCQVPYITLGVLLLLTVSLSPMTERESHVLMSSSMLHGSGKQAAGT
ncbi:UNVERIFIED_CONTAM: hypothetical protein FKN15_067351 [Acipenser sinensis]